MRKLNLDKLKEGLSGLTVTLGTHIHEALLVALMKNRHQTGTILKVEGTFQEDFILEWKESPNEAALNAWKNEANIAQFASVGLSLLLITQLTDFQSFDVALFGTGVDYWMDTEPYTTPKDFQRCGRIEISGIFKESTSNTIQMRVNQKKKQIVKSDKSGITAWIAVVALSIPKSKIERQ